MEGLLNLLGADIEKLQAPFIPEVALTGMAALTAIPTIIHISRLPRLTVPMASIMVRRRSENEKHP